MKRLFLLAVVCVAAGTNLYAQEFGIGARVGPSAAVLLTDEEEAQEFITFVGGGHAEVYTYKMFNKYVGIEGGLMLSQGGYGFDDDDDSFDTKITYFSVPLSARFKFGYFTVNPGIRTSFLIKAEEEMEDITDGVATTDIGFFVNPGIQFPIGITIGASFYVGAVNVIEEEDIVSRNFICQLSVGYTFFRKGN